MGKIAVSPNQPDIGASGDIVSKLLENVEQNKGYKIGFTGVQDGISLSGTIRNNRLTNCKMPNDNDLKEAFMKQKNQLLMVLNSLQLSGLIADMQ